MQGPGREAGQEVPGQQQVGLEAAGGDATPGPQHRRLPEGAGLLIAAQAGHHPVPAVGEEGQPLHRLLSAQVRRMDPEGVAPRGSDLRGQGLQAGLVPIGGGDPGAGGEEGRGDALSQGAGGAGHQHRTILEGCHLVSFRPFAGPGALP